MNASFTVNNDREFNTVELYLRKLYNTADGQPCQYLLSSSFQKWLYNVRACLRQQTEAADDRADVSACDSFETYLPNYHLVFIDNEVSVTFIKPAIPIKPKNTDIADAGDTGNTPGVNATSQKRALSVKKQKVRQP